MAQTTDRGANGHSDYAAKNLEERLTVWALRRAARQSEDHGSDTFDGAARDAGRAGLATAKRLFRRYLSEARRGDGARAPRLAPPGSPRLTRDERRLLRAVAAARAGDDVLLDNQLYKLALDRSRRIILLRAVRAWAAVLAARNGGSAARNGRPSSACPEPPLAETALLWAIRTWVAGRHLGTRVESGIDPVFARLGAPRAPGFLYGLMWVLQHGACRRLAVRCPCNPTVSEDEQALLDIFALTQERQSFERLLLLRTMLRPTAATPAGQSATGLVREINRAGLFLQPCFARVRHCTLPSVANATGSTRML